MKYFLPISFVFLTLLANCTQELTDGDPALLGTWTIDEIVFSDPEGENAIKHPQPGLLIFSDKHYSFVWTSTAEPRKPFQAFTEPTPEEIEAAFNSIVVNAGKYEVSENRLITRPIISRNPGFSGGHATYEYSVGAGALTLIMTDEYDRNGVQATWAREGEKMLFRLKKEM